MKYQVENLSTGEKLTPVDEEWQAELQAEILNSNRNTNNWVVRPVWTNPMLGFALKCWKGERRVD